MNESVGRYCAFDELPAQVGKTKSNNGIFMAFAPYDNPEVVASCVIEQAGGSNDVGVTLRRMFNKYFNITE